jgi:hypothetical protein
MTASTHAALRDDYDGPFDPTLGLADFTRRRLARLGREWLLIGHLQDRVGMPLVLSQHTAEEMAQVAIEEWMGASPIYSARVQRTLRFGPPVGERNVATIFKNIKLDIGAPHHFLDFQFSVRDDHYGEFWLDHCGALMDAEPMGDEYVKRMCHDIEDPTFDATAAAIHPCAKIRPIHRPPRIPTDRTPHCHWTAIIDETADPYEQHANLELVGRSLLAGIGLDDPGADRELGGWPDLGGDRDVNFHLEDLSHRALVLGLQEVSIQTHLLARAFLTCVAQRWGDTEAAAFGPGVFAGVAGIGAERLRDEFALPLGDLASIAKILQLHPLFFPRTYIGSSIELVDETVRFALLDGPCFDETDSYSWFASFDTGDPSHAALDAIAYVIDPRARSQRVGVRPGERHAFEIAIDPTAEPRPQVGFVSLAKISTGATVTFIPRAEVRR